MDHRNLMELFSIVEQVLNDEFPLLWNEDFFNNEDSAMICFTMKDYKRNKGLATFISSLILPGEDL